MLRWLLKTFGAGFVGRWIRACAEGKNGPQLKALYWGAVGKKTYLGFGLALACVAGVAMGFDGIETWLAGSGGAVLLSAGLIDKNWRKAIPEAIKNSFLYQFLRHAAPDLGAALATYAALLQACAPQDAELLARVGLTCAQGQMALVAIAAVLGHLGLSAEARAKEPPAKES